MRTCRAVMQAFLYKAMDPVSAIICTKKILSGSTILPSPPSANNDYEQGGPFVVASKHRKKPLLHHRAAFSWEKTRAEVM